jgi:hypothetical protein
MTDYFRSDDALPPEHLAKWAADRGLTLFRTVSASKNGWTLVGRPSLLQQRVVGQLELFLDIDRPFPRHK